MMARLKTLVLHDLRLQWRYGILAAYSFVMFFYVVLLLFGGERIPGWLVAATIYTDPAALGFFFLGGLMMLEKSEAVRSAIAMTPISAAEYLLSKTITLTSIALVAIVLVAGFAPAPLNLTLLLATVVPTSVFFVSMGVLVAQRTKTVTAYIMGSLPVMIPVVAPMFLVLWEPYPLWLNVIPTTAQFWLILVAVGSVTAPTVQVVATLLVVSLFALALFWLAQRQLQQEFGRK